MEENNSKGVLEYWVEEVLGDPGSCGKNVQKLEVKNWIEIKE